jgi:hypothetical protein
MAGRWYTTAVIAFWLLAVGWLFATKILPQISSGRRFAEASPTSPLADAGPMVAGWEIQWQAEPIGWAVYRLETQRDGVQQAHSVVHFDELPVDRIVDELFGPLADWIASQWDAERHLATTIEVETRMTWDRMADSRSFVSAVHVGQMREVATLSGTALDGKVQFVASVAEPLGGGSGSAARREIYRGQLDLPNHISVSGTLSPFGNLAHLRVGQRWTFQALRPVPFGQPLQLAQAEVDREEVLDWNGQSCTVRRVVLRHGRGASPSAAQEAFGHLWVRPDGTVLKQRLRMANLTFDFLRLPELPRRLEEQR